MERKTVLIVDSEPGDLVGDRLRGANCLVIKARDGESALTLAKHVNVDAVILVSTGDAMGRTETALNLRDIRPFSEIIVVARDHDKPTPGEAAAREIPHTRVLTLGELRDYLAPRER